jgi:hypothetical protein
MITICLDEVGQFEKRDKNKFIGGVIYTGEDYEEEKARLNEFFLRECRNLGVRYPEDLHLDYSSNNLAKVNLLKQEIEKGLKEYLSSSKKYHLTAMFKSRKERRDYRNISNLVDEDKASNLYEHMILGLLNNLLFANIYMDDIDNVRLEIPTRVSVLRPDETEKIKHFQKLGYQYNKNYDGSLRFYATDNTTFRTALSLKLTDSERKIKMNFKSINVTSIKYFQGNDHLVYLYLADTVCSLIKANTKIGFPDNGLEELREWAKNLTGGTEPYFWAYDDIDMVYNDLMDRFYRQDFIGVTAGIYEAKKHSSDYTPYYSRHWFHHMEKRIADAFSVEMAHKYSVEMDEFFSGTNTAYEKGVFIVEQLWIMLNKNNGKISDRTRYQVADAALRAYNHLGDLYKSKEYFAVCESLINRVDIETYLQTLNRAFEIDINCFDFEGAIEKCRYYLECLDILKSARREIAELTGSQSDYTYFMLSRGKMLSSLGQSYAFIRDSRAVDCFLEAIQEFGDDKNNNKRTLSYLMHHAVDTGDRVLFNQFSKSFFPKMDNISKQFESILEEGDSYSLYLFIKSIYRFYAHFADGDFLYRITTADYNRKGFNTGDHPWELIYKNIGMLLLLKGKEKQGRSFMQKGAGCVKSGEITIKAINLFTGIQECFLAGDVKGLKNRIREFSRWLDEVHEVKNYFADSLWGNEEEVFQNLNNKFTFMYT